MEDNFLDTHKENQASDHAGLWTNERQAERKKVEKIKIEEICLNRHRPIFVT